MKTLSSADADALDRELFSTCNFDVIQLMELAGFAVAMATLKQHKDDLSHGILIICGPGNNGGDGMVAARHLSLFGVTDITLYVPKQPKTDLYLRLIDQARQFGVTVTDDTSVLDRSYGVCMDAVFGFNFDPKGGIRAPYDSIIARMRDEAAVCYSKLVSIDVPSGWEVDVPADEQRKDVIRPNTLISLTAPKICADKFDGNHWVGGRFVPPAIRDKYGVHIDFGDDIVVKQ
ncbi:NADHX epimerase [Carpediemonas membranifera]|uniref:NAD(P)H-hydrate epimerase n=1 Tax=Carpediemonas membranifera TaxID=201153 RepID=A0A8J6B797_9EUKA|nr:NADHX epimerase [Carpediemonas membranifera]|eukprot:KAG9394574.1 NADHX epimerase [Carpediemonas membranifera]